MTIIYSVADLVELNLTTTDKKYVENYNFKLIHEVLLKGISGGVSGEIVRTAISHIPRKIVVSAIDVNAKNINKLAEKNLNMYQADSLIDLSGIWCELRQFFSFDEGFLREWVCTPLPALEGITPALLMSSIAGRRELRVLLQTMRIGDF